MKLQDSGQHSGIFRHNQAYSRIIQRHSASFRSLFSPGIFRALAYLGPWFVQSPRIFRTPISSEHWSIQCPGMVRALIYSWALRVRAPGPGISGGLVYSGPWSIHGICETNCGFCGIAHCGESLLPVSRAFILVVGGWGDGRCAIIQWGLDTFLIFSHFLRF